MVNRTGLPGELDHHTIEQVGLDDLELKQKGGSPGRERCLVRHLVLEGDAVVGGDLTTELLGLSHEWGLDLCRHRSNHRSTKPHHAVRGILDGIHCVLLSYLLCTGYYVCQGR